MAWDVVCLGELVIDMVPQRGSDGRTLYEPSAGGAPGNVAAGLAKLGRKPLMISKVGSDAFGRQVGQALAEWGVDTAGVKQTPLAKTRLSIVVLGKDGDRDFVFYRDTPADTLLDASEIVADHITSAAVLHTGILLMASPVSAVAQAKAMTVARENGVLIAIDPNFRPSLWPSQDLMLSAARTAISAANVVKLSDDELMALTGSGTLEERARSLWHDGMSMIAVTRGARGAELLTRGERFSCEGYRVESVDTTGAGDAFMASLISGVLDAGAPEDMLKAACAAGAIAASRKGAMSSMPDKAEIFRFLASAEEHPG